MIPREMNSGFELFEANAAEIFCRGGYHHTAITPCLLTENRNTGSLRAAITCKRMAGATLKATNGESNNVTVKDTSPEARGATCLFDSTFKDFTNEMPVEVTMELMVICC
jgi:hypothetical protein